MKDIIKELPIPITGLMLGLAAAGNLVLSYGEIYRNIFWSLSAVILGLIVLKIVMFPKDLRAALDNVVVASVFPTLSMSIMILSTYLRPFSYGISNTLWLAGVILHMGIIAFFTYKYVLDFNIESVFPSWFIVYVGIVVGSITAPAFNKFKMGQVIFYFGFISLLILLPIVLKRVYMVKDIPEPALPTLAIQTAPAALCLAGYMNSFLDKNMGMVYFLLILSQCLFLIVLTQLPRLLKLKFSPAYSAFTFPFVITGISIKLTNGFLLKADKEISILKYIVKFEEFLAIALVFYVLYRYIKFMFNKVSKSNEYKVIEEN
ncbi:MAG: TDT family transporter [Tissierellaceae bacterium]